MLMAIVGLFVCTSGVHSSIAQPFLGASPDECVYDPQSDEPYVTVYVEIKHKSAKLNFKYAPRRQKRNGLAKLRFFSSQGLV